MIQRRRTNVEGECFKQASETDNSNKKNKCQRRIIQRKRTSVEGEHLSWERFDIFRNRQFHNQDNHPFHKNNLRELGVGTFYISPNHSNICVALHSSHDPFRNKRHIAQKPCLFPVWVLCKIYNDKPSLNKLLLQKTNSFQKYVICTSGTNVSFLKKRLVHPVLIFLFKNSLF